MIIETIKNGIYNGFIYGQQKATELLITTTIEMAYGVIFSVIEEIYFFI